MVTIEFCLGGSVLFCVMSHTFDLLSNSFTSLGAAASILTV